MKIKKLNIKSFGRFTDKEIEFEDGFNIIQGPNEAGKTTIQKFILAMFYGLTNPMSSHQNFLPEHSQYRPWDSDTYGGTLEYHLGGAYYLIERNFAEQNYSARLTEARTGLDQTRNYPIDRRKEPLFAQEHLGFNRFVFTNTVFIGQLATASEEGLAAEVSERISRMAQTGTEDISVEGTLKALQEARKILTKEQDNEPSIQGIEGNISELEEEKKDIKYIKEKNQQLRIKTQELQKKIDNLQNEHQEVKNKLLVLQYKKTEERLQEVENSEKRIANLKRQIEEMAEYRKFPLEEETDLINLEETIKIRKEQISLLEEKENQIKEQIQMVEEEIKEKKELTDFKEDSAAELRLLYQDLSELNHELERDENLFSQFQDKLETRRKEMEQKFPGLPSFSQENKKRATELSRRLDNPEEQLKEKDLQYTRERLDNQISIKNQKGNNMVFSLILALAITVVALFVPLPAEFAELSEYLLFLLPLPILTFLIYFFQRQKSASRIKDLEKKEAELMEIRREHIQNRGKTQKELKELLESARVTSIDELEKKWEEYQEAVAEISHLKQKLESLQEQMERTKKTIGEKRKRIGQALEQAGISTQTIPDINDVEEFHRVIDGHFKKEKRKEMLSLRQEEIEREKKKVSQHLQELQNKISQLLNRTGARNLEDLKEGTKKHHQLKNLEEELHETQKALKEFLGEDTKEQLKNFIRRIRQLESYQKYTDLELEEYEYMGKKAEELEEAINKTEQEKLSLQDEIKTSLKEKRDLANVEREILQWENKLEEMKIKDDALETTMGVIQIVHQETQREYAPVLNQSAAEILSRITGGRYPAMHIDRELNIALLEQGRKEYLELRDLSMGTMDQVYFAFRIALADLIYTGSGRLPLILDDSFTQYDDDRLKKVMQLLMDLSRERQIILFCARQKEVEVLDSLEGAATANKIFLEKSKTGR